MTSAALTNKDHALQWREHPMTNDDGKATTRYRAQCKCGWESRATAPTKHLRLVQNYNAHAYKSIEAATRIAKSHARKGPK